MKSRFHAIFLIGLISSVRLVAAPILAKSAEAFVNSIGVNLHMGYDNHAGAYTNFPMIKQRLQEIGIRHYRDGLESPKFKTYVQTKDHPHHLGRRNPLAHLHDANGSGIRVPELEIRARHAPGLSSP